MSSSRPLLLLSGLFLFLLSANAASAQIFDTDLDLVPDLFDNCVLQPNGPAEPSNQVDHDQDGFGNACDADYDNDLAVTTDDYDFFLYPAYQGLISGSGVTDHNGDSRTTTADFSIFLSDFGTAPGPSGLLCAGVTIPCVP